MEREISVLGSEGDGRGGLISSSLLAVLAGDLKSGKWRMETVVVGWRFYVDDWV